MKEMYLQKSAVIILSTLICSLISLPAEAQQDSDSPNYHQELATSAQSSTSYDPSFGRLSLQFGTGVLFGVGGGAALALAAGIVAPDEQYEPLSYMVHGFIIGYSVISAFGVYAIANSPKYNASFGTILLGNLIGGVVSFSLSSAMDSALGKVIYGVSPIIGGIIANSNSIEKRSKDASAFLNISNGNTTLSTPSVGLARVSSSNPGSTIAGKSHSPTVELLNISL